MQSRVVLVLSLFGLAFVIVLGSFALHLTSARASTEPSAAGHTLLDFDDADSESTAPDLSVVDSHDSQPHRQFADAATEVELTPEERMNADNLRALLLKVHEGFDPEGATVNNDMIPYLAEMITAVNQHDHLTYLIEISEPDVALARQRAQTLNDVLRLNVLQPSKLHIVGREGMHAAHLDVSAQ